MKENKLPPQKALNQAFRKVKPNRDSIEKFKNNLSRLLAQINEAESEEFHKNIVADFLKNTYYSPNHFINTKGNNDFVIHNGKDAKSSVGVILEAKKPTNKGEMIKLDNLNSKALQELVLYFLRERIIEKNLEVKYLIITNIYEWFVFDASIFEKLFAQNKDFVKKFTDFEEGRLTGKKTDYFYKEIAKPAIEEVKNEIIFTHFDIRDYEVFLKNTDKENDKQLVTLFKVFSPENLLKLPFANDSNSLDKTFYSELLHIIGLTETKEGSKKIIQRKKEDDRNVGSIIENAIIQIDSLDKISRLENSERFGETYQDKLFNIGLELAITWINRILFLKLLESQLIKYHQGNKLFGFLSLEKIQNYDDLNRLFFDVLARKQEERNEHIKNIFVNIPYLNSSLFEPTEIEQLTVFISNLRNENLPIFSASVLKDNNGKRRVGELNSLEYLFEFLNAYDFSSEGSEDIQEDNKTLINASVLGLIFEKINGYKDGSFFTPGFITMYMCRETIRKAIIQKFNEIKGWNAENIDDLYNKIEDKKEANQIINSLKICDPAVGSGHFLVSALNEIIAIKSELKILLDKQGKTLRDYHVEVANDELIITDDDGQLFQYNPKNKESQRIQETLFHEKQTIIEGCLFGVDINPNSVKICRLRLWIELLKNAYYINPPQPPLERVNPPQPPLKSRGENINYSLKRGENMYIELETLPNIDINIKCGNSLISRFPLDADLKPALRKSKIDVVTYRQAVQTYRNAEDKQQKREMERLIKAVKKSFTTTLNEVGIEKTKLRSLEDEIYQLENQTSLFEESNKDKKAREKKIAKLNNEVDKLKAEIEEKNSGKIYDNAFEWRFEFPEVLNDKGDFIGFDVVIGNPPYLIVFEQNIKHYYEQKFFEFRRNNDLYVAFIKMAYSLIKTGYIFSFITPNTFIKGNYFQEIRQFMSKQYQLIEIIDFGNHLIFEGVNVFCAITLSIKIKPKKNWILKSDIQTIKGIIEANTNNFIIKNSIISKLDKLPKFEIFFHIKDVGFNYWSEGRGKVRGNSIGSRVFYKGKKETDNDIPYTKGVDINKYAISFSDNYLRSDYKTYLNENDTFRFSNDFLLKNPKIIYRQTSNKLIGSLDIQKLYTDKTVHLIVNREEFDFNLKYVLALFNSQLLNYFFQSFKEEDGRAFAQVKTIDIKNLPFKIIEKEKQNSFIKLVDKILTTKKSNPNADTTELEKEIDEMVYQLYELTEEEIAIIEGKV